MSYYTWYPFNVQHLDDEGQWITVCFQDKENAEAYLKLIHPDDKPVLVEREVK